MGARCHLLLTYAVAKELHALFRELFGESSALILWGCAIHDIGKISPGFAAKCPVWLTELKLNQVANEEQWHNESANTGNHGLLTGKFILEEFSVSRYPLNNPLKFTCLVAGHHGTIPSPTSISSARQNAPSTEIFRKLQSECWSEVSELCGLNSKLPPEASSAPDTILFAAAGWVTICDWISSSLPLRKDYRKHPVTLDLATQQASRALSEIGGFSAVSKDQPFSFGQLFGKPNPRPLQQKLHECADAPGLHIVEAVMGEGKTEAALWAAQHLISKNMARGIYFALPTQVTSDRIFSDRMRPFVETAFEFASLQDSLRLIHSSSWLKDTRTSFNAENGSAKENSNTDARSWFDSSKRALLAPFGVGTIDQALIGVLRRKHFFVRLAALAGKVVIIDEVHSYDFYTGTLVSKLIEHLKELGCTVIILSATLTKETRLQLLKSWGAENLAEPENSQNDEPGIRITSIKKQTPPTVTTAPCSENSRRMVSLKLQNLDDQEIIRELVTRAQQGQRVLWIRNTVDRAINAFKECRQTITEDSVSVALIHSRFTATDREENEETSLKLLSPGRTSGKGSILLSTQVAEQSLDLDADFLVTDLAPIDLILQRIGRLWRHGKNTGRPASCQKAETWVIAPDANGLHNPDQDFLDRIKELAIVYDRHTLLRSLETLANRESDDLHLPGDLSRLLEAAYQDREEKHPVWAEARKKRNHEAQRLSALAEDRTRIWAGANSGSDREGQAPTRHIKFPTQSLVLLREPWDGRSPLVFRHGESLDAPQAHDTYAKKREFAKAIARNSLKVARWMLADDAVWFPESLQYGCYEPTAFGWTEISPKGGEILPASCHSPDDGHTPFLRYSKNMGCEIDRKKIPRKSQREPDWLSGESPFF